MNSPFHPFANVLEVPVETQLPAFEWEVGGFDLLLRPHGGEATTVWAYLGQRNLADKLQRPRTLRTSRNKVIGAFRARRLWRMWPRNEGCTVFLRGEFGLLRFAGEDELVRFDLPRGAFKSALEAFETPGEKIEALLTQLEGDDDSDLNRAKRWREAHRSDWASLEFERGSPEELKTLLRALAHGFFDPARHPYYWHWSPRLDPTGNRLQIGGGLPPLALWPFVAQAFERVRPLLDAGFAARIEEEAWRGYDRRGDPARRRLPRLAFALPTMHEKMEALVIVREFLRGEMSEGEIEALLTPIAR